MFSRLFFYTLALIAYTGMVNAQIYSFDLESGYQGWKPDFADYPIGDSANWNLSHSHENMTYITPTQYGIRMEGDNFSDDLFFWVKRKIDGLSPNTQYSINFSIDVVTPMPPDGIGGSDLMLKAGATIIEPKKIQQNGYYLMNIDKSNQSVPGLDMDTLGRVHHTFPGNFSYHLVNFTNSNPFNIESDANGEIWIIIGAESQFETFAEFLIAQINFELSSIVGVSELNNSLNISVSPNPFSSQTVLKTTDCLKNASLTVYNSCGQTVKRIENISGQTIILHRENLSTGLFFISLTQNNKLIKWEKFIIADN